MIKILDGKYELPTSNYSEKLINLVKKMLQIDPYARPSANEIIGFKFLVYFLIQYRVSISKQ
jgi:hypothetical protein